jgi:hypothetical protein
MNLIDPAGDPNLHRSEHQNLTEPQEVRLLPGIKSNITSADYTARLM